MENINDYVRDLTFAFIRVASSRQLDDATLEGGAGAAGGQEARRARRREASD
jgi:hypothetical protein